MNNHFSTSLLNTCLQEFLSDFDSGVFINEAGEILAMKYENLPDVGTYGPMVKTVARYFQPREGDFVLMNDPYSGGTLLFSMGLVTAIQMGQQKFYFASRIRLKPELVFAKRIEEEGVRIPPTPLVSQGKINTEVLDAIGANPLAPPQFRERILEHIQVMQSRVQQFHTAFKVHEKLFSPANQKNLLTVTRQKVLDKMADLPRGEAKYEAKLESGEILRLKAEITSEKFICNFQGTSSAQGTSITDMIVHGACVACLLTFLGSEIPVNEGVYSVIDVSTPQGSFISAKYPAPLTRGIIEGLPHVATGILTALSEIIPRQAIAHNSFIIPTLTLDFKTQTFIDVMSGGTGATIGSDGIAGMHFWQRSSREMSVEMIETSYPLLILQNGIREGSGGKGQYSGGDGIMREFEVLAACEARWVIGSKQCHPKGTKNGGSGQPADLLIHRKNGTTEVSKDGAGTAHLEPHDRITIMSSGGGGYGKP